MKNLLLLITSLIIVYILSCTNIVRGSDSNDKLQKNIADKIIRFHVIANSDSEEDQALKLKVKDAVVDYTRELLSDSSSLERTRELLLSHKDDILDIAGSVISAEGYNYSVNMSFENCYFPAKSYGDITFPPGKYNSFRITIGNSQGKNWWCVLYPPLCFVDAVHGVLPDSSKEQLQEVLGYRDYKALVYGINNDGYHVEFRFKYLTFLN